MCTYTHTLMIKHAGTFQFRGKDPSTNSQKNIKSKDAYYIYIYICICIYGSMHFILMLLQGAVLKCVLHG